MKQPEKDPEGGLTAAGRKAYARKEGAHLRPGVKSADAKKLAAKGTRLLDRYAKAKRSAASKKNSLVNNINKRKRAGKTRPKSAGTVSKESYAEMKRGWPSSKKSAAKRSKKRASAKKKTAAKK